jgi:hypothetical protein
MDLSHISANWKTTASGVGLLALAALHTFAGVDVPGIPAMDFGTALPLSIGLIFAKDGNVTGGTVQQ